MFDPWDYPEPPTEPFEAEEIEELDTDAIEQYGFEDYCDEQERLEIMGMEDEQNA